MATIERSTELQSNNVRERIASRAYEVYRSRGARDGHDVDDWLEAENEVLSQINGKKMKTVGLQNQPSGGASGRNTATGSSGRRAAG